MQIIDPALIPFLALMASLSISLIQTITKDQKVCDWMAIFYSIAILLLAIRVHYLVGQHGVLFYKFGGFLPPIGILFVIDELSSSLSLMASLILLVVIVQSAVIYTRENKHILYSLLYILTMGIIGCLYTADLFNFYVSIELVAVASYALTALYSDYKRAIRAAYIYGIYGTVMTSIYFLSVMIIYGSYGTLNAIDIMIKSVDPTIVMPYSGAIYGNPLVSSKIALAIVTWVFIFKSAIIPNHFWLPEVYRSAPLPAIIYFSSSADLLGIYGLIRFYYTVFTERSLLSDFRALMLSILFIIGSLSSITASTIVVRQKSIRGLVAYSSIAQFSLALIGLASQTPEGITGSVLHLIVNGTGDALVLLSAGFILCLPEVLLNKVNLLLIYLSMIIGFLNLFGVIPVLPGFWSKALMTLGFLEAGMPVGAVVLLASSGLCAIGYFKTIIAYLNVTRGVKVRGKVEIQRISVASLVLRVLLLIVLTFVLYVGSSLLTNSYFRDSVLRIGRNLFDRNRLISVLYSSIFSGS